jgi:hypothetical protein
MLALNAASITRSTFSQLTVPGHQRPLLSLSLSLSLLACSGLKLSLTCGGIPSHPPRNDGGDDLVMMVGHDGAGYRELTGRECWMI